MDIIAAYMPLLNGKELPCYYKEELKKESKQNVVIFVRGECDGEHYLIEDEEYGYQRTIHKSLVTDNHLTIENGQFGAPRDLSDTWFKEFHNARIKASEQKKENLLKANIENFFANKDVVYSNSRYFLTPLPVSTGLAYAGPLIVMLGMLLELWETKPGTTETHENCGGKILIWSFGGSPLSGMNSWAGYCRKCGGRVTGNKSCFPDLWHLFVEQIKRYSKYRKYAHATIDEVLQAIAPKNEKQRSNMPKKIP